MLTDPNINLVFDPNKGKIKVLAGKYKPGKLKRLALRSPSFTNPVVWGRSWDRSGDLYRIAPHVYPDEVISALEIQQWWAELNREAKEPKQWVLCSFGFVPINQLVVRNYGGVCEYKMIPYSAVKVKEASVA